MDYKTFNCLVNLTMFQCSKRPNAEIPQGQTSSLF